MMETTPRTRSDARYRRVPTPKMSERKKKLFDDVLNNGDSPTTRNPYVRLERLIIEEAEDSDIGPMSPLEFSSSPSSFNEAHRIFANKQHENPKTLRTDFTNILNDDDSTIDDTGPSNKNIVQKQSIGTVTSDCTSDAKCDSGGEDDMMGPLCNSMKKLTSMTEQNYEQQMKTPSDVTTSSKSVTEPIGRNASFRKSLVFDSKLTPHDDHGLSPLSSSTKSSDHDHDHDHSGGSGIGPKARTSLTFNEPTISVRSFYGNPTDKSTDEKWINRNNNNNLAEKINSHEFSAAIAAVAAKHKMKFKSKSKSQSKSKSLSQRMKAAPSLWRFSGKAKFNHHKRQRANKMINKKIKQNTSIQSNADATNDVENVPPAGIEFTSRIEQNLRLQKILKEQPNALSVSREINWIGGSGSKPITEPISQNRSGFLHSDAEDDEDSENEHDRLASNQCTYEEVEVDVEEPTNRKFFKSKASSSAKKYRIMGRLSATMKRGGDLKFDPPPKRKKKRANKGEEIVVLHNEITSIIDRLSSPSKNKCATNDQTIEPIDTISKIVQSESIANETVITTSEPCVEPDFIDKIQIELSTSSSIAIDNQPAIHTNDTEKYRQMIPYNTSEPEKINQQESILELLISNAICNDETFKIFIAEPDLHKEKASQILDSLYCVSTMISTEYENENTTEWVNSVESMAPIFDTAITSPSDLNESNQALSIESRSIDTNTIGPEFSDPSNEIAITTAASTSTSLPNAPYQSSEKLFPIFNKNFNTKETKAPTFNTLPKTSKDWIPIGDQQYQLDVGQKEFGLRTCPQCEMQYSVHEPEDENLHMQYHNRVRLLTFKGWNNERVVTQIPEWNPPGRIIYICESDSQKRRDRVTEVLAMIDKDLGFAKPCVIKPKTLVYFAIVKEQIVGVCVVQPLERAHRIKTEKGNDFSTIETYPVKCGISRVWVAPNYRRHGIAAKLITTMRGHFLFGAFLSFDEIAFSSPTDDGKKLAASLSQRNDFLIYES